MPRGTLHHVELRVPDLAAARDTWGWLLAELGYELYQEWPEGVSYILGDTYIVFELAKGAHDRRMPGLSHLAFHGGSRSEVDILAVKAVEHGWTLLYADRHPFAGGPDYYAAFLENADRFKLELVAD